MSDVTGREQIVQTTPGASYGDTMMAAVGVGMVKSLSETRGWLTPGTVVRPDRAASTFYEQRYPLYRELYEQTKDLVHRL